MLIGKKFIGSWGWCLHNSNINSTDERPWPRVCFRDTDAVVLWFWKLFSYSRNEGTRGLKKEYHTQSKLGILAETNSYNEWHTVLSSGLPKSLYSTLYQEISLFLGLPGECNMILQLLLHNLSILTPIPAFCALFYQFILNNFLFFWNMSLNIWHFNFETIRQDCARPLVVRDPQTGLHRAMYLADGTAVPQVAPEQPTSPLKMAVFRDIGRHWWCGCLDF